MNKRKLFFIFIFLFIITQISALNCFASDIKKIILNNGLTLIYKENKSNEIIAMDLFIKSGSWDENDKNAGITNFIQRVLLKGTATKTSKELALEIESIGGIINADTADDYAQIYVIITKKHFTKGLEILFDVVNNPSFESVEIEKERNMILAQIKSKEDSIFETTYDLFNEALYGKYPYHKTVSGTKETVLSINRKDLINFHKKFYKPPNMVLVVVGNIAQEKVERELEKIFNTEECPDGVCPLPAEEDTESPDELIPQRKAPYKKTYKGKFRQAYLMLGYILPEGASLDYPVLKVINALLGGGMSSRLFVNLRDKEALAYEIGSFYPTRRFKSKFVMYLGLDKKNITKARNKLLEQIEKLKQKKVTDKELREIKNYLKGTFILDHQTNKRQAWYLGWYETIGKGYLYDNLYLKDLERVTPEDIIKTSKKYLKDNNWVAIEIIPEDK